MEQPNNTTHHESTTTSKIPDVMDTVTIIRSIKIKPQQSLKPAAIILNSPDDNILVLPEDNNDNCDEETTDKGDGLHTIEILCRDNLVHFEKDPGLPLISTQFPRS